MATVSTDSTYTFTVTGNRSLTAVFEKIVPTYTITVTVTPEGSGAVTGTGQYQEGDTVTLTATVNEGYTFDGWKENGAVVSSSNPYTFTAAADRVFTAAFSEKPASRLPAGYTEVEYIQSNAPAYINTGVYMFGFSKIVIDIEPIEAGGSTVKYIVYARRTGTTNYIIDLNWKNVGVRLAIGSYSSAPAYYTLSSNPSPRRMSITIDKTNKKAFVAGESEVSLSNVSMSSGGTAIFLLRGSSDTYALPAKVYSCQIYNSSASGGLLRDFVPCKNPSGAVGLYDLVGGTFFANAGTGSFTAGPAV